MGLTELMDYIINIDYHLAELIQTHHVGSYLIIFLIIFCETGLVVTPFLPGESLVFVTGALCVSGSMDIKLATIILVLAAIGGDTLNYNIGKLIGHKAYKMKDGRYFKKEYLDKTHMFYEKHGGKLILISRFLPIVRTFAPFVAGMSKMNFWTFLKFNAIGSSIWVLLFILGGYFFGNIPVVQNNFALVILAIIIISILPGTISFIFRVLRKK